MAWLQWMIAGLALALAGSMARAQAVESADVAAARSSGLLGTWAIDCNKPAGPENFVAAISVLEDGSLTSVSPNRSGGTYEVREVVVVGANTVEYSMVNAKAQVRVTREILGSRSRVLSTRRLSPEKANARRSATTTNPLPWMERCDRLTS
jgi:hypothetical protein